MEFKNFFFRLLYAIAKIAIITARIILHLISYPQFTYDLFHMHDSPSYLLREHMNPKLTCSQRQWLHSSVGRASHRYGEVTGSSPIEVLNFFQASLSNCKNCDHNCEDHSSFDNGVVLVTSLLLYFAWPSSSSPISTLAASSSVTYLVYKKSHNFHCVGHVTTEYEHEM